MTWLQKIKIAEKNKGFTPEDIILAGNFESCVIGERTILEKRELDEGKLNMRAIRFGVLFAEHVYHNDYLAALEVRKMIMRLPELEE